MNGPARPVFANQRPIPKSITPKTDVIIWMFCFPGNLTKGSEDLTPTWKVCHE
jgi:hypothetical protein